MNYSKHAFDMEAYSLSYSYLTFVRCMLSPWEYKKAPRKIIDINCFCVCVVFDNGCDQSNTGGFASRPFGLDQSVVATADFSWGGG